MRREFLGTVAALAAVVTLLSLLLLREEGSAVAPSSGGSNQVAPPRSLTSPGSGSEEGTQRTVASTSAAAPPVEEPGGELRVMTEEQFLRRLRDLGVDSTGGLFDRNEDGTVTFDVEDGEYFVHVPTYRLYPTHVVANSEDSEWVTMPLPGVTHLQGRIRNSDGSPVANTAMWLHSGDQDYSTMSLYHTDGAGRYEIPHLVPRAYGSPSSRASPISPRSTSTSSSGAACRAGRST